MTILGNEAAAATRQVAGRMRWQGAGELGYGWGGRRVRSSSRSSRGVPPEEARCARREGEEAEEAMAGRPVRKE